MKPATVKESPLSSITRKITLVAVAFFALTAAPDTVADVSRGFTHLLDAVVRIDVREESFDAGARRFTAGIGSGVIVSADGLILTNAHVASPRSVELSVTLASLERVNATLVGWDHWTDLALLRIDLAEVKRRGLKFTHAKFADSDDLFPGQTVYAVGTPHGLTRTVTRGIISNNRRYFADNRGVKGYETGLFNTWLQTDAAINPGNSGGPLVDDKGRVVGINSRGYLGADNLAFAIPANIAQRVAADLAGDGEIIRSYLGIVPAPLLDLEGFYALKQNTGLLLNSVDPGSPAARAGLRGGDIVLSINGTAVDGRFPEQLPPILNVIAAMPVGSPVKLVVKRGEKTTPFDLVTEKLESRQGEEWAFEKWGLTVRKVSRAYARENQFDDDTGLLVIGVQPGFPAAVAGLDRGDIITKINQERIDTLDVAKGMHAAFVEKPEPTLIEAKRDRRVSLYILKP
jgi:serine protease Do